jgi:ParB family chromosome partitioning protein
LFGKAKFEEIAIDQLHSGAYQPRDTFSDENLVSLAKTIEQLGVLEPLIVRPSPKKLGQFEIVAGERRYLASKLAGLAVVPCLLSHYSNEQAAQIALIENTCREALNPIAEALAMQRLASEFGYTHDEIGVLLGISRAHVTNLLRLLTLDERIQHWMKQGHLSVGHGKVLAIKKEWTISVLDNAIKTLDKKKLHVSQSKKLMTLITPLEQHVTKQFGYPIKLTLHKNETGCFRIHFHNRDHMHQILDKLGCTYD